MENTNLVAVNQSSEGKKDISGLFNSPEDILSFGKEATQGISLFSDKILSQFSLSYADESSKMLNTLNTLMNKFNKEDFSDTEQTGFMAKLLSGFRKKTEDLLDKYTLFNKEIDKIFIEIKKYEYELTDNNSLMEKMYEENMQLYAQLEDYIKTCKQFVEEVIDPKMETLSRQADENENGLARIELGKYLELKDLLEQRIYDLEMAKAVSVQSAPQIKLIQKGNYNLIRKINSSFVITLPLFKQGIIQAITVKRQKLHMQSMAALDESTNRLLKQNAQNIVENTKSTIAMNQNSAVSINTLIESYNTIIYGMKEMETLQAENRKRREESMQMIELLKTSLLTGKPVERIEEPKAEAIKT